MIRHFPDSSRSLWHSERPAVLSCAPGDWLQRLGRVSTVTLRLGSLNLPIAGGGYFRLFPYDLTRWNIRRLNTHEHQPAVVYLHQWEIDPAQPRLQVGGRARCDTT